MTPGPDGFGTAETLANEPPPGRRFPRSLLLVAATSLALVTGAGVAAAAVLSPAPSPSPSASPSGTPSATPSGAPSDRAPGWRHRTGIGGPPIHGEYVVPDGAGAYVTVATQYGDVTAVDQDSVTVKSEDGYTKEYAVNADTRLNRGSGGIDTVKTGQKVMVMAKVDGGTATAVAIRDRTLRDRSPRDRTLRDGTPPDGTLRDGQGRFGRGDRRHRGDQPGQPTSSPSPTAAPTTTS
ncbi:hypothetical protein ACIBG4_25640 [Nonomuraea sp. NPDC050383]|uniref:hypothetical protein n=1 Tax=Nonomuraea sp. NPDC050383 TaxID=3364362 RepID=UPI0037AB726C